MRCACVWGVVLVIGLAIGFLAVAPGTAQVKVPPDFAFQQGKDSPAPVTFSHEQHKAQVDKCTACHTKVFKMKKGTTGTLTMAAMKEGQFCGTCHNGKTEIGGKAVFSVASEDSCKNCHKKP